MITARLRGSREYTMTTLGRTKDRYLPTRALHGSIGSDKSQSNLIPSDKMLTKVKNFYKCRAPVAASQVRRTPLSRRPGPCLSLIRMGA